MSYAKYKIKHTNIFNKEALNKDSFVVTEKTRVIYYAEYEK